MKRCSTCNRAFADDTLTVCPDDGNALASAPEVPATQSDGGLGGKATWTPSQDQLAEIQQYVATTTKPQRKIWPWLVITVAVLVILIGLGVIVAGRL